ncbi:MAG: phosphatase PAP2 family protein [Anaerotignaceae bacterium]
MDFTILNYIAENFRNEFLDNFFIFITTLGNSGFIWIAIAILLLISKKKTEVICVVLALLFSLIICNLLLKNLVARPRPFAFLEDFQLLIPTPLDYSFPSGHTSSSIAAAFVIWKFNKKLGVAVWVLAILIIFSRLYLYVHFPTDILGGIITGLIAGYLGYIYGKKIDLFIKNRPKKSTS